MHPGFSRKPVTQSEARARRVVLAMEAAERKAAVGGTDAELRARMAMALEHENAPHAEWAHSDVGDDDAIELRRDDLGAWARARLGLRLSVCALSPPQPLSHETRALRIRVPTCSPVSHRLNAA